MFKDYSIVRLRRAFDGAPVEVGGEGAIVMVHPAEPPAYEVEFFNDKGGSIGVYTVRHADLDLIQD